MVRKFVSFGFAQALVLTLGFAMAQAHPLKGPGKSISFSIPCLPASAASKATSEAKLASPIDSVWAAENAEAPACVVPESRGETTLPAIPVPAFRAFPPLLNRPPPANS